jgi:hypothetical protein
LTRETAGAVDSSTDAAEVSEVATGASLTGGDVCSTSPDRPVDESHPPRTIKAAVDIVTMSARRIIGAG